MPSNIEAEQAVLGSCLLDPDLIAEVKLILPEGSDFYLEKHCWIFKAMLSLYARQVPVDFVTLTSELESQGKLNDVGGSAYLTGILNSVPTGMNAVAYAKIIKRCSVQRQLIYAATVIAGIGHDGKDHGKDLESEELLATSHKVLDSVIIPSEGGAAVTLKQASEAFLEHVAERMENPNDTWGIPTKLLEMDQRFGGLQPGDLWIIAADPGMGKTSLMNKILLNVASQGIRATYFTLEMTVAKLMMRFAQDLSGVEGRLIRQGKITKQQRDAIIDAMNRIEDFALEFMDKPISTDGIRAYLLRQRNPVRVIGVDYSKLLTDSNVKEDLRIEHISNALKNVAKEFELAVILIHTLTRSTSEDQIPMLSELSWSAAMRYNPDVVLSPWFDKKRKDFAAKIAVLKYRDGPATGRDGFAAFFDGVRWGNSSHQKE